MTPTGLPAVVPQATADLVEALPPRLRKRLDAAAAKLAARPLTIEGGTVRVALDDETALELRAPDGVVRRAADIRCSCLLAPACVHRAAAACAAPVAQADPAGLPQEAGTALGQPDLPKDDPPPGPGEPGGEPGPAPASDPGRDGAGAPAAHPDRVPADALWAAGAAVLEAGIDGAGAVLQAELLRAAHTARLAALPRPAAAAVHTVNHLRAARAAAPDHRLAELAQALRDLLATTHHLRRDHTHAVQRAAARGTARRAYTPGGSLRLYGLCTEPVLTTTGQAGAVTWTADAEGRIYSVPDLAPGGPPRAIDAAARPVRLGDTALTHRELARTGLAVSGATVSADGRLGAGKGVQAVRAAGAPWSEPPLDRLWAPSPAHQVARALTDPDDPGLLFLEATLLGTVRETGGDCLLADCSGLPLRLAAAHEHPDLAYRDNLRTLAAAPGRTVRLIGRLVRADHPRVQPLAVQLPAGIHDLGLDRLQRSDLPAGTPPPALPAAPPSAPAPLHLLRRRTEQAVAAGRRALALPATDDTRPLRRAGLTTAAELLDRLRRAAADRGRDHFGRLLPADTDHFAEAWLAAALYTEAAATLLCRTAWEGAGTEGD
ncbi:hypothetical protein ACFQLX_06570 [Streptomyces polyrhachis]|uniref:SWIM-type domain-containing protein n=1 Tax=Streptomyces polyrhachis TaxID=1282885 RepID=A0ABW2GE75_9ACTN